MSSEWGKSSGDPFAGEAKQNTCVKAKSATVDAVHGDQLADCEVNEFARTDEREGMNDASELTRSIKDIRVGELNLDADNTEREEDETSSESPVEGSGSSPIPEEMFYPGSLTRMSGMRLSSVSGSSVALAPEDASPLNASQCESMTAVSHMTVHHVAENNNTRDRLTPAMAESQFANFLKLADDPEIISHFVTLDTEDKIFNFLCNIPAIKAFVPEISTAPKNDHEAAVNRKKACDLLQDADYQAALKYFNKSIMLANPDSETLTLAYLDRSAVFHRAGKLKKANQDIQRAMQLSKSPEVTQLLQSLQARFQFQQDSPGQGRKCVSLVVNTAHPDRCVVEPKPDYWESLGQGQRHLQYGRESGVQAALPNPSTPANAGGMEAKLQLTTSQGRNSWEGDGPATTPVLETIFDHGCNPNPKPESLGEPAEAVSFPLRVDGPENPLLPGCSTAVEPCFDPAHGWGLVASRDITPGEVLMTETPAVKILLRDFWDSHCTWCLQAADACVPCYTCTKVVFCSEACRDAGTKSFHGRECGLLDALEVDVLDHRVLLALRWFLSLADKSCPGLGQRKRDFASGDDHDTKGDPSRCPVYHQKDLHELLPIMLDTKVSLAKCDKKDEFWFQAMSVLFTAKLLTRGDSPSSENDQVAKAASTLWHILLASQQATHPLVSYGAEPGAGDRLGVKLVRVGECISWVLGAAFQSCAPNAVQAFVAGKILVRAVDVISAGTLIKVSFGVLSHNHNLEDRSRFLLEKFNYVCRCLACVENWPRLTDWNRPRIVACPGCQSQFELLTEPVCGTCGRTLLPEIEAIVALKNLAEDQIAGMSRKPRTRPETTRSLLRTFQELQLRMKPLFVKPCKDLLMAQSHVMRVVMMDTIARRLGEKGAEDAFAIAEDYASFREDFPVTELEAALKRDSRLSAALRDVMSGQNFLLKLNVVSQRVAKDESIARQNLNATKMYVINTTDSRVFDLFREAVRNCKPKSELLGSVYAARSKVHFTSENRQRCLEDVDRALKCKIPKSMKAWLIKQKFKVLHNIAPSGIVGSLREMLVNEDTDRDIKDLKKEVKPVGKFGYDRSGRPLNEPLAEAETHPDDIIFRPDGKENMLISGASDAIVLKYKPNRGRYYVAARQIQPGEILLVEKPYASVLFADRWATNCQYCGDEVQNGVPCQDCAAVIFCSDTCIRKAKQFHDIECGHMRNLAQFAVPLGGYLAYRMITCHPLDYFLQRKKDISRMLDPSTRVMPLGFMQANEYINVFCLTDHADQKSADEIRENMITALYFTKLLESAEYFGKDPRMEDKVYIAMLLLRNLMVFDCSHFTYHQRLLSEKNGLVEPDDRGMAIFSACSLANHSCNPNASHYFVKSHLVFRSFGVIQDGEDVTISYGEVFASSDRDTRRDYLKGYYFNCGCEACAGDWPQLDDIETKLKCPHCRTQVPGEKVEDMLKLSCPQCKMAWKTFVLQFMNVKKLALEAEEKLKNGDVKNIRDHVWHVQEYLKALYVVTSKPDAEFYTVANDLTYLHNLESLVVQREAEDLHFVKAESVGVAIKSEKTGKRRSGKTKGSSSKESVGDEDHIRGPPPPPGSNYGQYLP